MACAITLPSCLQRRKSKKKRREKKTRRGARTESDTNALVHYNAGIAYVNTLIKENFVIVVGCSLVPLQPLNS